MGDEKQLTGKILMKRSMQIWMNTADTLLAIIVMRFPSPRNAQECLAIRTCDTGDHLMMYVSKGHIYAFGRVFIGTIGKGRKVRIRGSHCTRGSEEEPNMRDPVMPYRETVAGTWRASQCATNHR